VDGVLIVDKPAGGTSFDVVRKIRRAARVRRVGHGGTLDPLASGVLPVCLGEATKLAQFLLDADKEYEVGVCFGVETDTYDADGAVTARRSAAAIDEGAVRAALPSFVGKLQQVPPAYSALKRAGRALYDYARAGETVEIAPRPVEVFAFELLSFAGPGDVRLRVRCSKGTYVRSLVFDIGRVLGPGAHVTALRRTRSGPFRIEEATALADVVAALENGEAARWMVPLSAVLTHLPVCVVGDQEARALVQGKRVARPEAAAPLGARVQVVGGDGALIAVADCEPDGMLRTVRVFNAAAVLASSAAVPSADRQRRTLN
jgi:tRNA pseudouridine55 synthase